ncbi:cation diffusion facilitator family transporter [Novosphingobium sp. ZN18A2]|uniref:cation diffusion facilitator family transporter n=1 Tax=Novosphingobium sp. ZN18A2 TaxID=3079861 RepID=UPI0030CC2F17
MGAGHHHHGHSHHDHHGLHSHAHGPGHGRAFAVAIALNLLFVFVEAGFGLLSGSMALVADAGHNLSDVLGLGIAWFADTLSRRPPTARFTYGFKSSSILAALANASLLMLAVGAISAESVRRLFMPEPVAGGTMMVVAAIGIVVNVATALLFMRGSKDDLNIRGAFLHMVADAAVSAGVVLAGLAIMMTGQEWIDPVASLAISAVIAWGTWGLLKDSLKLGLAGVPEGIDEGDVRALLLSQTGVEAVHDLHIWPMSTTETALTAHLLMPGGHPGDAFLHDMAELLLEKHGIGHVTVQVEALDTGCVLMDESVV